MQSGDQGSGQRSAEVTQVINIGLLAERLGPDACLCGPRLQSGLH